MYNKVEDVYNTNIQGGIKLKNSKYKNEENIKNKQIEDKTKYGEFVSSLFSWIPVSKQKEKAEKLQNITKSK